jgi:selenide,water dikinase
MGGRPLTAMNIVCFPIKTMDISVLKEILAGGLEKVHEAGAIVVGGHTVEDNELKYGLSVTGVIHPEKVVLNTGARAGDKLILTKPLGTGIISTAVKGGVADAAAEARIVQSMTTLNRRAAELMQETGVHAGTDITGFGLLGHAGEMIEGSDVGMLIHSAAVPFFPEAREYAAMGMIPGGLYRNREFRSSMVSMGESVPDYMADILFDPQTSGGLFMSVAPGKTQELLERMHQEGIPEAALVGEVVAEPRGKIVVD